MKSIPSKPKLNPAVALIQTENGIIVDGLGVMEVLKGIAAETVLPHILTDLDGTKTIAEIVGTCAGIPEQYIYSTLDTLSSWGMLVDGGAPLPQEAEGRPDWLARYALAHEDTDTKLPLSTLLSTTVVTIHRSCLGSLTISTAIASVLAQCGVQYLTVGETDTRQGFGNAGTYSVNQIQADGSSRTNVIDATYLPGSNRLLIRRLNCPKAERPNCSDLFYSTLTEQQFECPEPSASEVASIIALTTSELLDCILHLSHAMFGRMVRLYRLDDLSSVTQRYPRSFFCTGCAGPTAPCEEGRIGRMQYQIAVLYNCQEGGPPTRGNDSRPTGTLRSKGRGIVNHHNGQTVPLPTAGIQITQTVLQCLLSRNVPRPSDRHSLIDLSAIASLSVGLRERAGLRKKHWAPSAGNFGATHLRMITRGDQTLSQGIYTYDAASHNLYRSDDEDVDTVIKSLPEEQLLEGSTLFVYTVRRDLLLRKYGSFSYKLGFLDGGCAIAQAQIVAQSAGISSTLIESWSDKLISGALGLDGQVEHIAGMIVVGKTRNLLSFLRKPLCASESGLHAARDLNSLSVAEMTTLLVQETRPSGNAPRGRRARTRNPTTRNQTSFVTLPLVSDRSNLVITELLSTRASVRSFAEGNITLEQLAITLASAAECDERNWKQSNRAGILLNYYVVCKAVEKVSAGIYRYCHAAHQLEHVKALPDDYDLKQMFVQAECGSAAATVLVTADIQEACDILGSVGYRNILVRTGAAGQRASLGAAASGLSSVVLAGIKQDVITDLLLSTIVSEAPLFACAIGHRAA